MFQDIIDKEKYLIQPFVTGEEIEIEMFLEGASVKAKAVSASTRSKVKLGQKMLKDLKESYTSSKFKGYRVCLSGVLHVNEKNVTSLVLNDIMLKNEKTLGRCSKRYSIRYENLVFRFLSLKSKNVTAVFSQQFSENSLNMFIKQFIETNKTDYALFVKDSVSADKDIVKDPVWTYQRMKVVGYEEGTAVIRKLNEKDEVEPEEELPCIDTLIVQKDSSERKIKLSNIPDAMKAQMLADLKSDSKSVIGKTCFFGEWKVAYKVGEVFFDLEDNDANKV